MHRALFSGFLILFALGFSSSQSLSATKWKIAIALNEDTNSSSTSNSIENHIENGIRLALGENSKLASEVDTTFLNHGETAQKTLEAIKKINSFEPEFVIGMGNSFQALLSAKHLSPKSTLISPVATSDEILKSSKNIFLFSNINSIQAKILVDLIKKQINEKSKVLLVEIEGCPYCKNMADEMAKDLKVLGVKYETRQFHLTNLKTLKANSESSNFNHIILPVHEEESAIMIDYFYPQNSSATFWGGDGWGPLARYIKRLPYINKLKASWLAHYHVDIKNPVNRTFVSDYRKKYSTDPVDTSAFYYEAMKTLLKMKHSDSPSTESIKALNAFEGVTGTVRIYDRYVIRPMPLLSIKDGNVILEKVLTPQEVK